VFADACELAAQFTAAVVISAHHRDGKCSSSVGTFVALNDEGWILTAAHIFRHMNNMDAQRNACRIYGDEIAAISANTTLTPKQRRLAENKVRVPPKDSVDQYSAWWSEDGIGVEGGDVLESCDLAVVKLSALPKSITKFATLRNPANARRIGTSLCRLGFPFPQVTPIYHADKNAFELPAGTALAFFPNEGIYTRTLKVPPSPSMPPFDELFIETSSPGLKGQSGGPIFDTQGNVWAVQVQTHHLALGFDPKVPDKKETVHQFLNPGLGVSSQTIVPFLQQLGVKFSIST
jgi:hypothetical protein